MEQKPIGERFGIDGMIITPPKEKEEEKVEEKEE